MEGLTKIIFLCTIINYLNAEYVSYNGYKVYNVKTETNKGVQLLRDIQKQNEYVFWNDVIEIGSDVKIMVEPKRQGQFEDYIKSTHLKAELVINDVQSLINDQLKRPNARNADDYNWDYYQNFEEILSWMENIVDKHSDVATLVDIGRTIEGRPIRGIIIDYKKNTTAPLIGMLEGGIHAREWISPATLTWVIKEFLTSKDDGVRKLAETFQWHIFPVINPDGYSYTFSTNRMWRKNRNGANSTSCSQWNVDDDMSKGIDLNRNFGFMWMTVGASQEPCLETYAGPVPFSELESRAIANYVLGLTSRGNMVYYVAFHSFSQMILVPYSHVGGGDVITVPNYADMYEIAIRGADKLKERHNTSYTVGTSLDILYAVSGSSFDWVKGMAGVPIVYLFELRDVGEYGFLLPPELIIPNCEEIMDALVEMDRVTNRLHYYTSSGNDFNLSIFLILSIILLNL